MAFSHTALSTAEMLASTDALDWYKEGEELEDLSILAFVGLAAIVKLGICYYIFIVYIIIILLVMDGGINSLLLVVNCVW